MSPWATLLMIAVVWTPLEKVDMSREQLFKTATHVIRAETRAVYASEPVRAHGYDRIQYVAELRILDLEKGDGIAAGELIYVRYWQQTWAASDFPPPGTNGHRDPPRVGEELRVYLARNAYDGFGPHPMDGGFNVIGANGFERCAPDKQANGGEDA